MSGTAVLEGAYHNYLIAKCPREDSDLPSLSHLIVCSQWIGFFCVRCPPLFLKAEGPGGSRFPPEEALQGI